MCVLSYPNFPTLIALVLLAGCAAPEYSKVPEPIGEWVPANPRRLTGEAPPSARPVPLSTAGQGTGDER